MKVFVLPATQINLFPSTVRPLSLQSTAQVQLIQQAIAEKVPVAVAFFIEGESTYRPLAGFGQAYIADRRSDGSILMYVQGEGKVDLSNARMISNGIINYQEVIEIEEQNDLDDDLKSQYLALSKYFAQWIDKYIIDPGQKQFFLKSLNGTKEVIAACSAYLVKDFEMQYQLMEFHNINDQIKYLHRLMLSQQLVF
jgi:uncharacterized protein